MRKRFLTTLLALVALALLAPASWLGLAQAQTITPLTTFPVSQPGTLSNPPSGTNFAGAGADYTVGGTNFTGSPQDWYTVNLLAGYTYVFTMWQPGSSSVRAAMSLQNPGGTQVMWSFGEDVDYCGMIGQLYYTVPPGQQGTYTLICAYTDGAYASVPYTLTIPYPTGYPTFDYATVSPAPKNIASLASTYTDSGPITSASYYGSATSTGGSPPVSTNSLWWNNYSSIQVPPPWVMYYQNWYSTSAMTVNSTYQVTLTMTTPGAGNPVLSLQNSSGAQQAFSYSYGQATATIYFTPSVADTYYIICTQDLLGVPGGSPGCHGVSVPNTSYTLSIQQVPVGTTLTTVSAPTALTTNATTTVTVTVTGATPSAGAPIGNVTLTVGSYTSPLTPVNQGSGTVSTATFSFPTPAGGAYTVTANFTGTGTAPPAPSGFLSSSGTAQLNVVKVTQLTMLPVNVADSTSPSSYSGVGADVSNMGGFDDWNNNDAPITPNSANGLYQNWYTVPLAKNQTYVISILYNGNNWSIMSIQNSSGKQLTWGVIGNYNLNSYTSWQGANAPVPQLVFQAPADGTYTIIVAGAYTGQFITGYTLMIPNPAPPVPTPINPPFTGPGTFTTSSYYGGAASSTAWAPPQAVLFAAATSQPNWVDYFQNWYSAYLPAGSATTITMTMSLANVNPTSPMFSIQNSAGTQVNYSYTPGANTTSITFTPTVSDTYTIICSQDQTGPGGCGTVFGTTNSYTLTVTGAGTGVATTTTVFPGIDVGGPLNVTVTVTALGGPPTGTVTLSLDDVQVGPPQTLTNGSTVFNVASPGAGNHTLVAIYSGALPGFLPSQATAVLQSGIPNTRLAPPADNNDDRHTLPLLARDFNREPVIDPMEGPVLRYWAARN